MFFSSRTGCLLYAKDPSLPYHLPICGWRIIGFIPYPRVLVLFEMQSASLRFQLVSPCLFPNIFITETSINIFVCVCACVCVSTYYFYYYYYYYYYNFYFYSFCYILYNYFIFEHRHLLHYDNVSW